MSSKTLYSRSRWRSLLPIAIVIAMLFSLLAPQPAAAWKIPTHVYLTDVILADALDDGQVTIYRVDYEKGEIIGVLGAYQVAPDILAALRDDVAPYRAGTVGPDAYPDLATGQQTIHPDPTGSGVTSGTDAWLQHLWQQSNEIAYKENTAVRAYTIGFLTHAAGDIYAHTFVNNFSGGAFTFDPAENALKHVLLEDYMDKRLPKNALTPPFFAATHMNINGVEDENNDFIYRSMIDARPGTLLDTTLLPANSPGTTYSIPRIFSTLRANLETEIENSNCQIWQLTCIAKREYKKAWRDDIDEGLQAWPQTSHQIMLALAFNAERTVKSNEATNIAEQYVLDHLLSMAGLPDFVGLTLSEIQEIIDLITPHELQAIIDELKANLLDTLLMEAIGMNKEQLKEFAANPELWFDVALNSWTGENITLTEFNQLYLRISDSGYNNPDEAFDYRTFPPAHNTVTLGKLALLSQGEVNRLLADLGSAVRLNEPNIVLGFISTLDGGNQWLDGMVVAQDRQAYEQIFMRQAGERFTAPESKAFQAYIPFVARPSGCLGHTPTIWGTPGNDVLVGTPGNDVIMGAVGNDVIFGNGGHDLVCGGEGDDMLMGGAGDDVIQGGSGNDQIYGEGNDDKLYGGAGDDVLAGGEGHNLIFAGEGADVCTPDIGNFECEG